MASATWHRASSDLLDPGLLGLLGALPSPLGAAALGLLSALRSWCSSHRTTEIPPAVASSLGRLLRLAPGQLERLTAALVGAGYLEGIDGAGYQLREEAVVRPVDDTGPRSETGKAARMRRYRAGKKASPVDAHPSTQASTQASTRASTETSTQASTGETGGVYRASTGTSPEASTVDAPPSHTLPPRTSTNTSTKSPPSPPAGVEGQGADSEEIPVSRPAGPPSLARYAAAYALGVSRATGHPCPPPTSKPELEALGQMALTCALDGSGARLKGPALAAWLTETAEAYAKAKAGEAQYERGFSPEKCIHWLRSGRPAASPSRPARVAPSQPANPGSAAEALASMPWKPARINGVPVAPSRPEGDA